MALRYAIKKPLELFWAHSSSECLRWLLSLLDDDVTPNSFEVVNDTPNESAYGDMGSIDRLFEKGPMNVFFEECVLAETVSRTFVEWMEEYKFCTHSYTERSQLFAPLQTFVKKQAAKCDESLPQNLLYSNLYKTLAGLVMMNVLLKGITATVNKDEVTIENKQLLGVFNETVSLLKDIRSKDRGHCFSHFKLQELGHLVLED